MRSTSRFFQPARLYSFSSIIYSHYGCYHDVYQHNTKQIREILENPIKLHNVDNLEYVEKYIGQLLLGIQIKFPDGAMLTLHNTQKKLIVDDMLISHGARIFLVKKDRVQNECNEHIFNITEFIHAMIYCPDQVWIKKMDMNKEIIHEKPNSFLF